MDVNRVPLGQIPDGVTGTPLKTGGLWVFCDGIAAAIHPSNLF